MDISLIDFREWNYKVKYRNEVNKVCKNDITMKIDNLYCCCETKNGCNNIMVFSEVYDIKNVSRMFMFIFLLYVLYGIEYITVSGSLRRYGFLERKFSENVVRDPNIKDKRVLYIKLDVKVMYQIRSEILKNGV